MSPLTVEVHRGGRVESAHRVHVVVADADGRVVLSRGDPGRLVYPRSAIKPFQALPLIEGGGADAHGVSDAELAVAVASHGGEPVHVGAVGRWLARMGLGEEALACGPHLPLSRPAAETLIREARPPGRLHNNCSGKHTGMLAACLHEGWPAGGYARPEHPLQAEIASVLASICGLDGIEAPGTDGCSLPAFVLPLFALARAAANLTDPSRLPASRAAALRRIGRAMGAHPELVAGEGRICTEVMRALPGVLVKTGAEGVFLGALPAAGLGVALKVEDGASRAAETALMAVLDVLHEAPDDARDALARFREPVLRDWNGAEVGRVRVQPGWAGPC